MITTIQLTSDNFIEESEKSKYYQLYSLRLNRLFNISDSYCSDEDFKDILKNNSQQRALYVVDDGCTFYYFDGDDIYTQYCYCSIDEVSNLSELAYVAASLFFSDEDGDCDLDDDVNVYIELSSSDYDWFGHQCIYDRLDGMQLPDGDEREFTVEEVVRLTSLQNRIDSRLRQRQQDSQRNAYEHCFA